MLNEEKLNKKVQELKSKLSLEKQFELIKLSREYIEKRKRLNELKTIFNLLEKLF